MTTTKFTPRRSSPLGRSGAPGPGPRGTPGSPARGLRRGGLGGLGLARPGELGAELPLELRDDLGVRDGLPALVLAYDLGLLVDGGGEVLLGHLLGRAGLHDCLGEGLVHLGDLAGLIGLLELAGRHDGGGVG